MLEKLGLPPKPSMRGGNWVLDASHCQGCSSQFTFINRKHHCRRCGGLFCNGCTQQRMVLRGQGDSPVRICGPCKNLEDAARFEMRYGHKNKSTKGSSRQVQKQEEEILGQVLGSGGKQESHGEMISELLRASSSSSSASLKEEPTSVVREGEPLIDVGSNSPEDLRQQAAEEKKRYRSLKAEGKSEEALQAFKRGKELERQAGALELQLRKNRRMASKMSNLTAPEQKKDDTKDSSNKRKLPTQKSEDKKDLAAELRDLGWSDADLHDADKKPGNISLEGELSSLIKENTTSSSVTTKISSIDKSQVVALKRKALQLKREGKLAEAKEELKKAKVLEKQIEEQELLGEADDSEDELSALIRTMDDDKHDDILLDHAPIPGFNFENIFGMGGELNIDDNLDITDNDMNDPELATALKSFGWTEEDEEKAADHLQEEVHSLKREAVIKKREGNIVEAKSLLDKAKLLEKNTETTQIDVQKSSNSQVRTLPTKSKMAIQRELLALKKNALALRREGRMEEADEELKKGKALEQQLEELENAPKRPDPKMSMKNSMDISEEGADAEVTEQDMHDPALMSVLKNLGWNDDDADAEPVGMKRTKVNTPSALPRRSKAEIQRELLGVKRKALALRRQGKTEEADEELERARDLEKQLADMEASSTSRINADEAHDLGPSVPEDKHDNRPPAADYQTLGNPTAQSEEKLAQSDSRAISSIMDSANLQSAVEKTPISISSTAPKSLSPEKSPDQDTDSQRDKILAHKRKAVALKREGKLAEAREELRRAKLLESGLKVEEPVLSASPSESSPPVVVQESRSNQHAQKPLSGRDRFKMQQESLAHKRNALKLRREGKIEESEAEFELAKALESQLEEASSHESNTSAPDVVVEDLLDPQLMSALKSIGWQDSELGAPAGPATIPEPKPVADKGKAQGERAHLEELIKGEKVRALNLKREGKQAEALEALRSAKRLEKKLASLTQ